MVAIVSSAGTAEPDSRTPPTDAEYEAARAELEEGMQQWLN